MRRTGTVSVRQRSCVEQVQLQSGRGHARDRYSFCQEEVMHRKLPSGGGQTKNMYSSSQAEPEEMYSYSQIDVLRRTGSAQVS